MEKISELILEALNDERYKARTIVGVAKVVKVSPSEVVKKLNTIPELNRQVKIYPRRAQDGKVLITTRERFDKSASIKDKFIDAFSTHRVGIKDEY